MEKILFYGAFFLTTVSMGLSLTYAFMRRDHLAQRARWVLTAALALQVLSLMVRTVVARQMPDHEWYVPWSNWYESFAFFAAVIISEYLLIQRGREVPILGAFITPLAWACLVTAVHSPEGMEISTLPTTLQSHWMPAHVSVMFVAYALFANAFGIGLAYLLQERQLKSRKPSSIVFRLPALDDLDALIYRVVSIAFPLLTLGLFFGALWAQDAWGRYWGWDPKETWAFITWMVYLIYLVMRLGVGWRGRKTVYLSLIGFVVVLFTYIGVNFLSDLHGFLSGGGR